GRLCDVFGHIAHDPWTGVMAAIQARREEGRREQQRQEVLKKHLGRQGKDINGKESKELPELSRELVRPRAAPSTASAAPAKAPSINSSHSTPPRSKNA